MRVAHLFIGVGIEAESMQRYPQEFSGGQRQRLGIAKARAGSRKPRSSSAAGEERLDDSSRSRTKLGTSGVNFNSGDPPSR